MRVTLAMVALAVTSMVALSFLIPLGLLLSTQVHSQATQTAQQRAAVLAPVLTIATEPTAVRHVVESLDEPDRLCVHLPNGTVIGSSHAPAAQLREAETGRASAGGDVPGGWDYLQPVLLGGDRVAVVEAFVPEAELSRGVATGWTVMSVLAAGLVAGSVVVADRLGSKVVRSSRGLSRASNALGAGDLDVRVDPAGPRELHEAGVAFNAMADRIVRLLDNERELIADLSHRLRTPLTALYLAGEQVGPVPGSDRLSAAIRRLEHEVDSLIRTARARTLRGQTAPEATPDSGRAQEPTCDVAQIARQRVGFWSVLAAQQDRSCTITATEAPTPVGLLPDELAAVVDALIGNVLRHTRPGVGLRVEVRRTAPGTVLAVEDDGDGIADPDRALSRGASTGGSTGLGLDIARRVAVSTGGGLRIGRAASGGARVEVVLGLAEQEPHQPADTRRRRSRLRR
ncbi:MULTISPECIES: HAMP domain-containing sensor histidine kinase [unclassified Kitasatospora]|uniref:sensor histidine kinase n=1 Tax=unclassified Kitasatospora TaxID=2633591 RepID=UPI003402DB31